MLDDDVARVDSVEVEGVVADSWSPALIRRRESCVGHTSKSVDNKR
jgi:hypothetical protein